MERDPSKFKVLIFTERKSTAPLFKALSKQYKDKLLFGEVRSTEREIIDKFKVTKFPTLLIITDPFEYQADLYENEFKIDLLNKFLNKYSYQDPKYEKKVELQKLTVKKYKNQGVCGKKSSNFCFIIFAEGGE